MNEHNRIKIPRQILRPFLTLALFGLVYFGAVRLGLLFMLVPEGTAAIWPASGVALSALLLSSPSEWRFILGLIFLINFGLDLNAGYSLPVSAGFALSNTLEPALGGLLALRLSKRSAQAHTPTPLTFTRLASVIVLALIALLASLASASLGALVAWLGFGAPYWNTWAFWLIEDALGILLVTPLIVAWVREWPRPSAHRGTFQHWLEGVLLLCVVGAVTWFGLTKTHLVWLELRPYMIFPFLGWAAMRFGQRQVSTTLFLIACILLGVTTQGFGSFPLGGTTPAERLVMAQIFLSIASITALLLNAVMIERKKAEAEIRDSEASLRFGESALISSEKELRESEERWHFALEGAGEGVWDWDIQSGKVFYSRQWKALLGYAEDEIGDSLEEWESRLHPEDKDATQVRVLAHLSGQLPVYRSEHRLRSKEGRYLWILARGKVVRRDADGSPARMITTNSDITPRKEMELSLRYHAHLLENVSEAIISTDANFIIQSWNQAAEEMYGWTAEEAIGHVVQAVLKTQFAEPREQAVSAMLEQNHWKGEVVQQRRDGVLIHVLCSASVVRDETGAIVTQVSANRDITERMRAEAEIKKQLAWLEGLHEIDRAMAGSLDMKLTFEILLGQVTGQLGVDAASLLLFDPAAQVLNFASGRGFRTRLAEKVSLPMGKGYAGQAVMDCCQVLHNPIPEEAYHKEKSLFAEEGFRLYIGLPLVARGQVKGVLEVFHRSPLPLDPEWLGYLNILAGQAAIAIENLQMVERLQRANQDLELAYDSTLESWSRVLDLRDKETEGHSRRVMEHAIRLARAMGIAQSDLVHIYRGALLHDIGKMGVPDRILWKKGPLDAEEWKIMREHQRMALEMLSSIPYLRQAVDIPYSHHEKWDGSGYPRGLSGAQIPLSARIFAVVDVWDALLSDRPYRPAWTREQAMAYIRNQAGKHFDPQVAELFLRLEQG